MAARPRRPPRGGHRRRRPHDQPAALRGGPTSRGGRTREDQDGGTMTMTDPVVEIHLTEEDALRSLRADARAGLTSRPKWLPPKWFYDARGSELFEKITELPEYYPTRAEREVLDAHAGDVAGATGARTLVELGPGSSEKTRLLPDA